MCLCRNEFKSSQKHRPIDLLGIKRVNKLVFYNVLDSLKSNTAKRIHIKGAFRVLKHISMRQAHAFLCELAARC